MKNRRNPQDHHFNRTFRKRWNPSSTATNGANAAIPADPVAYAQQFLDFTPDPAQSRLLSSQSARVILNCTRQWGKSTVAAIKAVHRAIACPNSLILIVSRSQRQSNELLRKIARFLPQQRRSSRRGTKLDIRLTNGSRIVSLPGNEDTIRGFSAVDLLLIDEASRVSDALYHAVRPMLAMGNQGAGGDIWLMSTPNGKRGFFWEEWSNHDEDDDDSWFRLSVPATDCPRFRPQFLEREKRSLGERAFNQEYLCHFTDAEGALFREELVRQAFVDDVKAFNF